MTEYSILYTAAALQALERLSEKQATLAVSACHPSSKCQLFSMLQSEPGSSFAPEA